ncbi:MAG TPA: tol-pal system protein YbgF, partial [Dongiaceae bacterium]|nr:tol-pal system protein YbgF [Dongiaceae bacterium]
MALLLGLAPLAAAAQDNYVQVLADRVDRLQRELSDLQRDVYSGGTTGGGEKAAGTTLDANQEVRLQQIEDELRGLTGRIEEVSFRTQQL